jgi:hypothetical protein
MGAKQKLAYHDMAKTELSHIMPIRGRGGSHSGGSICSVANQEYNKYSFFFAYRRFFFVPIFQKWTTGSPVLCVNYRKLVHRKSGFVCKLSKTCSPEVKFCTSTMEK